MKIYTTPKQVKITRGFVGGTVVNGTRITGNIGDTFTIKSETSKYFITENNKQIPKSATLQY
ncbi:MAG: hypothetical protein ACOVK2_02010 [Candidatus Fonsibacter sp.]